jgi:hypothetical protein
MRVRLYVHSKYHPRATNVYPNQDSCPEDFRPEEEANLWWKPYPILVVDRSFGGKRQAGDTDVKFLNPGMSVFKASDMELIINDLRSQDQKIVYQTVQDLSYRYGLLRLKRMSFKPNENNINNFSLSESISDWQVFGIWVRSIVDITNALRTKNRVEIVNQLKKTVKTSEKYYNCMPDFSYVTDFNDLTFAEFIKEPQNYSDSDVFDLAINAMRVLARGLGNSGRDGEKDVDPDLFQHAASGELEFVLISETLRGVVSTFLLMAMSVDATLAGIDSDTGAVMPRSCANQYCDLMFIQKKGEIYGGKNSSCRIERTRGHACKYAREKLGLS